MRPSLLGREWLFDACFALARAAAFALSDLERRTRGRLGSRTAWIAVGAGLAGLAAARILADN